MAEIALKPVKQLRGKERFTAKGGTFKRRSERMVEEVDFFGQKWARAMGRFMNTAEDYGADVQEMFHGLVANFYDRVQLRTPIDLGGALAGWEIDIRRQPGQYEAVITNMVPYIVYLEFGWSQQAPKGMARITLHEMAQEMSQAARQLVAA